MDDTLLLHAAVTFALAGLIWFVQVVHYPLFQKVGVDDFTPYSHAHMRRTTFVVAPLMLTEVITAVLIALRPPLGVSPQEAWLGFMLVFMIWLSTALLQVPQHQVLERGYDQRAHELLVVTNWIRTAAWTARAILVAGMLQAAV